MNDLQHEFIRQSVADLESLAEKSRSHENKNFPDDLLREFFRVLHTIKGTAQVFGLSVSAHLAHTLENLLAAFKKNEIGFEDLKLLAPQGVEILARTLSEKNFQVPESFTKKIQKYQAESKAEITPNNNLPELPAEFSDSLSAQEKSAVNAAVANGSNLFVLEIGLAAASFASELKDFRAALAEKGEIIASLPSAKFAAENKIGFRIVYATGENAETIVEKSTAKIIYQTHPLASDNLPGFLRQIEEYGKILARRLGKTIEFEISANAEMPTSILKIVFDALTHFVRNAVSHAFSENGKITIEARTVRNGFILKVADNGKGLDEEKIRRAAIEKNLISTDRILTVDELTNLIFAPELSTADEISDISGRGVGLDAVKTAVENAGGKISVESKPGAGAKFEIFLPLNLGTRKLGEADKENETDKN